jgi:argininosuccinate synthase
LPADTVLDVLILLRIDSVSQYMLVDHHVTNTMIVGLKSRGCYETPGLTCLRSAHIDLEGLVLDREVRALRDQFLTFNYAKILYSKLPIGPSKIILLTINRRSLLLPRA